MPDSAKLKQKPEKLHITEGAARLLPVPRTLGSFVIFVTASAFIAGVLRNELALTLFGTIFLTILAYCFFCVFFMGLVHRRRGISLSMTITRENVNVGRSGEVLIKTSGGDAPGKNYFWTLPAVLVRCELCLETRDGRVIRHYANPGLENDSSFPVTERGAYYGESDRFVIMDAPGFFRLSFPIPHSSGGSAPRLFALPAPAEEPISVLLRSGGTEQRSEAHYRKSDEFTDHRPYVPGDDPRRINWKLYSHTPSGELFVREGEPEPPPHSRLLILIDTEADRLLFTQDEGRRAVDLLCENALAAGIEFLNHGMDILVGYTGGKIIGGSESAGSQPLNTAELATALAHPAAVQWPGLETALPNAGLPEAPKDRAVLVLALPRAGAEASALDNFLKSRTASQGGEASAGTNIIFIYDSENPGGRKLEEAAGICVNLYNRRPGVHAEKKAALPHGAVVDGGAL